MKTRLLIPVAVATANPDGLVAPGVATLRPGTTTFTVSTPDTQRRYVGVVGLKPGASFDTYLDNMATVLFSADEAAEQRAGVAVQRDVAVGGGVVVYARAAQSTTVLLAPGTYYLSTARRRRPCGGQPRNGCASRGNWRRSGGQHAPSAWRRC